MEHNAKWLKDIFDNLDTLLPEGYNLGNGWNIIELIPIQVDKEKFFSYLVKWENATYYKIKIQKYFEHVNSYRIGTIEVTKEILEDAAFNFMEYVVYQLKQIDEDSMKTTKEDLEKHLKEKTDGTN